MTTAPTPEEFMALPSDPDEAELDELLDPLVSIAESLRRIADQGGPAASCTKCDQLRAEAVDVDHELASLQQHYERAADRANQAEELIGRVLAICKPSVSKLANQIREVLTPDPSPAPSDVVSLESPAGSSSASASSAREAVETRAGEGPPNADADVEQWRAYARSYDLGPDVDLQQMNRSQIRTLLGIAHPEES